MMGLFKEQELQGVWLEDREKEWFQSHTAAGNVWLSEKTILSENLAKQVLHIVRSFFFKGMDPLGYLLLFYNLIV